jgi:hypothetical protein
MFKDLPKDLNGRLMIPTSEGEIDIRPLFDYRNVIYNPLNYGAKYDGVTDDTQALKDCIDDAPTGATIEITNHLRITSSIVINKLINIKGITSTVYSLPSYRAKSCIIKDGEFDGIVLMFEGSKIEDIQIDGTESNTGHGLVLGGSRIKVKNVSVTNQGNDGINIGSIGTNWNMWSLENIVALDNSGYGVNIDDTINVQQNANAGTFISADLRENGLGGLGLGKTIDNVFVGVSSQLNTGYGVELREGAKGNQFFATYTEGNTVNEFILKTGADRNYIFGYRSGVNTDAIVDNGLVNFILGRSAQSLTAVPYLKNSVAFKEMIIEDTALNGFWRFRENASDRSLEIVSDGTSSTPLTIKAYHNNSGKIIFNVDELKLGLTSRVKGFYLTQASLNAGTVSANTSKEVTMTVAGCKVGDAVIATPQTALTDGIVWNAYISATDTVKIKLTNVTAGNITVGSVGWTTQVTVI